MAKAPVVEEAQMRHAIKVAAVSGQTPHAMPRCYACSTALA
jgi:hypothetical protein